MNPKDLIKNKEEEIGELMEKANKEEKRDIYSGDLVRMHSKLKILESELDSLIEMNKLWLDRIDEFDFMKEVNYICEGMKCPSNEKLHTKEDINNWIRRELKSEDKNEKKKV